MNITFDTNKQDKESIRNSALDFINRELEIRFIEAISHQDQLAVIEAFDKRFEPFMKMRDIYYITQDIIREMIEKINDRRINPVLFKSQNNCDLAVLKFLEGTKC